ncbi:MAG: hypothetical protein R3D27_00810 [Hyphomicrobiaceae bacterium]
MQTLPAIVATAIIAFATSAAASDRIDARQDRQIARISQGVRSGELTQREAARLRAEQSRIALMEARARADGHLSAGERARIAAAQDRASRHIYAEKHDGERRHATRRWHRW